MENRLLSLDVFRGMTIFFMIIVNTPGSWQYVFSPLLHAKWDGCTPTDLVFPFFLLIVGVSMAISYSKYEDKSKQIWIQKSIKRGLIIILIGLLLNWFPFYTKNIQDLRLFGVLQRIGLAFLFGAILITMVKKKHLWILLSVILIAYWLILLLVGDGDLSLEGNLGRIIDLNIFGESHIYKGYGIPFDPEGLLSTLPSIGTVILGFIVGNILIKKTDIIFKIKYLIYLGLALSLTGLFWNFSGFPINKPIWSSSYVLFSGGLGTILLSTMMWIIDVKKLQKWTYVFKAFGRNPLISFVLSGLFVKISIMIKIGDSSLMSYLYAEVYQPILGNYFGSFIFALSYALFIWLFALALDKRGIIVKV